MHRLEESEYSAEYRDDDGKNGGPEAWNNPQIAQYPDDDNGNGEKKNYNNDQHSGRNSPTLFAWRMKLVSLQSLIFCCHALILC